MVLSFFAEYFFGLLNRLFSLPRTAMPASHNNTMKPWDKSAIQLLAHYLLVRQ